MNSTEPLATAMPQNQPLSAAMRRNLRCGRKGQESHMEAGGNKSKVTKASAGHWEKQGTCCCLSMQVMAWSCSQYLIRWGKWAIPAPWSYTQIAFCTTSSLCWPTGKAMREHSHVAEGTRRTGHPSVWLRSCFLLSLAPCTAGLRRARSAGGFTKITDQGVPAWCIYLLVHHLLSRCTLWEVTILAEDCSGQPEAKASLAACLDPAYVTEPSSSGRLLQQIHTYSFSIPSPLT